MASPSRGKGLLTIEFRDQIGEVQRTNQGEMPRIRRQQDLLFVVGCVKREEATTGQRGNERGGGTARRQLGLGDDISRTTLVHLGGGFLHGGTVGASVGVSFRHSCDRVVAAVCDGGKILSEIATKVNFCRLVCAVLGFRLLGFTNSGSSERRDRCKVRKRK